MTKRASAAAFATRATTLKGIAFPYLDPDPDEPSSPGALRRDHPEVETDGAPVAKYCLPLNRQAPVFRAVVRTPQLADTVARPSSSSKRKSQSLP